MDDDEARALLRRHLQTYRARSHAELSRLLARPQSAEVVGASGTSYGIEVEVFWDDEPGGNVRVMGTIDDGGLRAFVPLAEDFILSPDGTFVGE
jgi:hypothetical protein